ncbi:Putative phosphatase YieH [hydrothermal vent metagenome]|uniref:Phosphatase YieH n=1 Tax=hydrothermal vent metagenome TaxID=652676 RepID=A0A3B0SXB0_9ZZZZ
MAVTADDLVIFDCDGVLVDTEPVANKLLARIVTDLGHRVSYEDCRRRFVGRMLEEIQSEIETAIGRKLGAGWCDGVRARTEAAFAEGIEAVPGITRQVKALIAAEIPLCVASSGKLSKMHVTLGQTDLLPLLGHVLYSAEMVGRGKPAPDLFFHAAAQMGVAPERCVVIEDSVFGVQAGVAAGMRVLGYAADPLTDDEALKVAGATVFHSMDDLPGLL